MKKILRTMSVILCLLISAVCLTACGGKDDYYIIGEKATLKNNVSVTVTNAKFDDELLTVLFVDLTVENKSDSDVVLVEENFKVKTSAGMSTEILGIGINKGTESEIEEIPVGKDEVKEITVKFNLTGKDAAINAFNNGALYFEFDMGIKVTGVDILLTRSR